MPQDKETPSRAEKTRQRPKESPIAATRAPLCRPIARYTREDEYRMARAQVDAALHMWKFGKAAAPRDSSHWYTPTEPQDTPPLVCPRLAADYCRCSVKTVMAAIRIGILPVTRTPYGDMVDARHLAGFASHTAPALDKIRD
ncbi:MAG: hypothetical protein LIP02_04085 [Bacteroidales bacterium]|nr:hypothetical protein [Bacteroidales bacterium]